MKQHLRIAVLTVVVTGLIGAGWPASPAAAQNCDDVNGLLRDGNSVDQIMLITGLTAGQIQACRGRAQAPILISPEGPAPHGAAGPAPLGAAGPAPHGAAGPAPHGAAGPAPFGTR